MDIKHDKNILKFSFYGFFKNLKFFEPFLYLFFLSLNLSYLQIGILISIREITKNILEVPSGVIADNYGRKKSLKLCFVMYIFSFVLFYISDVFYILIIAMIFYGTGEAFRSGTHKAIILSYLDHTNIPHKKVEVYGRTKSYSLLGSALSALIGAFFVFIRSNYRLIFILSIIPYIIDFILISTYPDFLNNITESDLNFKNLLSAFKRSLDNLVNIRVLRRGIINSAFYDGYFKVLKDYLQPLLRNQLIGYSLIFTLKSETKQIALLLGLSYCIINILSAISSRNSYKIKKYVTGWEKSLNNIFIITSNIFILIAVFTYTNYIIPVILMFIFYYVLRSLRRPIMIEYISRSIKPHERATLLSIESQLRTLTIIIIAPFTGFIADNWGLAVMFIFTFVNYIIVYMLTKIELTK